jgi:hypothetical protein
MKTSRIKAHCLPANSGTRNTHHPILEDAHVCRDSVCHCLLANSAQSPRVDVGCVQRTSVFRRVRETHHLFMPTEDGVLHTPYKNWPQTPPPRRF